MKTASAKAKGRRLQNYVWAKLIQYLPELKDDMRPAIMGEQGEDIKLSIAAQEVIPFSIEIKNREKLNIWDALAQAEKFGRKPLVVFKKNYSEVYCALKFEDLLELLYGKD